LEDEPAELHRIKLQLDVVIGLLRVLASKALDELRRSILSTEKKEKIYNLCDGEHTLLDIANATSVTSEYVRLTVQELRSTGLVIMRERGKRQCPARLIEDL